MNFLKNEKRKFNGSLHYCTDLWKNKNKMWVDLFKVLWWFVGGHKCGGIGVGDGVGVGWMGLQIGGQMGGQVGNQMK